MFRKNPAFLYLKHCCIKIGLDKVSKSRLTVLLPLLFLCIANQLFAQQLYKLSGKVTNKEGVALPGATVLLHELHRGTLADVDGYFEINRLRAGTYHVHVTFVGHESFSQTITLKDKDAYIVFQLKESTIELNEVVVEANPFKSGPVEQSMTIETVDQDYLRHNSQGTFAGSLQKLPGISAINTGTGIAKPVIRGMSFNRVIVNERGVKQEGQQWGADHGLEIDQYAPDRVEIIKGPASLLYGSDAMGGVINIEPAPIPAAETLSGSFLSAYKSNNNLVGTSTMLQGNRKGKFFRARFSTQRFSDYKVPADSFRYNHFVYPIADGSLENTAGKERNLSATAGISGNWGFTKLTISNFHQKSGLFPGAIGLPGEYQPAHDGKSRDIALPRQVVDHFKVIANTNILLNNNWLEMDFGYQRNDRREEGEPHAHGYGDAPEGTLALGLVLETYTANIKYHQQVTGRYKMIYGMQAQYQENDFSGFEFLLPAFTSLSLGAYSYHELGLSDRLTVNGGVRIDYGSRDIAGHAAPDPATEAPGDSLTFNSHISRDFLNVSGALGLSYYPSHNFNAKLNLGSSFRMPTAPELSSNGIHHGTFRHEKGDSTLDAERGYQADLNLTYHTKDFHVGFTPFIGYYNRFIYLSPRAEFSDLPGGGQVYRYRQDDAFFAGGEVSTEYHVIPPLHVKLTAEYVCNYNLRSHRPLPFTPPFSLMAEARYSISLPEGRFSDAFIEVSAQQFAAQNRVDQNEEPTPGYMLASLSAGIKLTVAGQPLDLYFAVRNLMDETYLNHLSRYRLLNLPEQGRNFTVSLKIPVTVISGDQQE